ncbi:MAG: bifunctional isocitrate dehydrogenase kinase/phosphatase [Phycisphaerales bacterium]|nr:bifunctional isocitrate dehydrogenase kinase/phosphatase [Phycisphaerales bacterium]
MNTTPPNVGDAGRRSAREAAERIFRAFRAYRWRFRRITLRARSRFERRQWKLTHQDAVERLDLYGAVVRRTVEKTRRLLGQRHRHRRVWALAKRFYAQRVASEVDIDFAETFFNSVARRVFSTVGVDPEIEFVRLEAASSIHRSADPILRTCSAEQGLDAAVRRVIEACAFETPLRDASEDSRLVADRMIEQWKATPLGGAPHAIEALTPVFYRGQGAFVVGRVIGDAGVLPMAMALNCDEKGVGVQAVILTENGMSILFSFTRSYFHVATDRPHAMIRYLKSIMPRKPTAELYTAVGYNKHGKTQFYRDLLWRLECSTDKFDIAPGTRGMVMIVFTLPSHDVVFKVIRDRFEPPKNTSRAEVRSKYQLVFKQDRAGRLVDAQEFEYLAFATDRFTQALLDELTAHAAESVRIEGGRIVIRHLYTERRVRPLNLYLSEVNETAACSAAIDYGQAIKDLAATNIFPGDLPVKNFGVTRHGRVIFYDYDELTLLDACNFRRLPKARCEEDELRAEPWFFVGPNDIFPEEFGAFLGLQGAPKAQFMERHGDLLTAEYWKGVQAMHAAGASIEILPYERERLIRDE